MKIIFEGTIEELMEFFGGIEEEKKETEKDNSLKDISEYARFFDDDCIGWTNDPEKICSLLSGHRNTQMYDCKMKDTYF